MWCLLDKEDVPLGVLQNFRLNVGRFEKLKRDKGSAIAEEGDLIAMFDESMSNGNIGLNIASRSESKA